MFGIIDFLTEFSQVIWKEFTQVKTRVDKILVNSEEKHFKNEKDYRGLDSFTDL